MANRKRTRRQSKKAGLPPGTLVFTGERKLETVRITIIDYDENTVQEKQVARVEDCFQFKITPTMTWVNIDGLHDVNVIEKIGKHFDLHPPFLLSRVTSRTLYFHSRGIFS